MQVICIERHDIDQQTGYLPLPLTMPDYWPEERLALLDAVVRNGKIVGYSITRRMDLLWAEHQGRPHMGRTDIVLMNTKQGQRAVYPGRDGALRGDVALLSDEDREWALAESAKCWETAQREPLYMEWMFS